MKRFWAEYKASMEYFFYDLLPILLVFATFMVPLLLLLFWVTK